MAVDMKEIRAGYNEGGQRLDKLLRKTLTKAPDGFIYKMLRKKNITLNDKKACGSEILCEGDVIRIWLSDETYAAFAGGGRHEAAQSAPQTGRDELAVFDRAVIYEDRDILVINKPAGMLSQRAGAQDISAVELLTERMLARGEITAEQLRTFRPSVCNRLDRNTSGVLVCGKSLKGLQNMSAAIRERNVKKDYLAVVDGELRRGDHVRSYIVKDHAANTVRILDRPHENGDEQLIDTEFKPVYTDGERTLVMVRIHTGRTHQIRVQLSAMGHPICGDGKYGRAGRRRHSRQLLHAWSLRLPDGRHFTAPVPPDMKEAIGGYGWEPGKPADFEALPLRI